MTRRDSWLAWFPVALRFTGLAGVVFVAGVWLVTNRIEPSLLALFGSMVGIGEGADAVRDLVAANADRAKAQDANPRPRPGTEE